MHDGGTPSCAIIAVARWHGEYIFMVGCCVGGGGWCGRFGRVRVLAPLSGGTGPVRVSVETRSISGLSRESGGGPPRGTGDQVAEAEDVVRRPRDGFPTVCRGCRTFC
jgi:hypothetical protein